ncbi:IucA/IucC family protein [Pseudomonas sp. dw_358]|uniref:IucA/IucC family protein n=1 Tax=Pseudomonas sp. dw_358 TaxID=2720083 RepID=UPI001BD635B0|nr:IucA/IucC family protein [Pseudomonas sp. dw_358]
MSGPTEDLDQAVIGQRIIDCCLREDIRGLSSQGQVHALPAHWRLPADITEARHWLFIRHLGEEELVLPVHRASPMQAWSMLGDRWLCHRNDHIRVEQGYSRWLQRLSLDLDDETRQLFAAYQREADCAVEHRRLCAEAYGVHIARLERVLDAPGWDRRLLGIDQLASYLDHPFYPTARAKSGFDAKALQHYAPEFAPSFTLRWLAVPSAEMHLTSPVPTFWPSFADVGLNAELAASHSLLPVHPLTWTELAQHGLPEHSVRAPLAFLQVEPTLSVRTVLCVDHPHWHFKLPLLVCTLGARNLRLIKPSTLYDGYWFQRILHSLSQRDPQLAGRYLHVDEQHGGHAAEQRHLAYIVRRYPDHLASSTLVPVAALASPSSDGRLFLEQLAARFHGGDLDAWLNEYLTLLLQVHLRLWLHYGIALEANQQNAVLVFEASRPLRLLMKDNDAARLWPQRFGAACPDLAGQVHELRDERIRVNDSQPLGEMFCTITLQLNIVAVLEAMIARRLAPRAQLYGQLRQCLHQTLAQLESEGIDCLDARRALLDNPHLPVKYLLSAGSLFSKARSGAHDINKFYGYSARNFLLEDRPCHAD